MRVLRTSSYCFPEIVASSHLEKDRYEAFSKAGIELVVHTPTPTRGIDEETYKKYKSIKYEELYDGHVKINRFSMFREGKNPLVRALRYGLVNLIQYRKCIKTPDVDVIYGGSTPPTQGVMCAMIKKKLSKKQKRKESIPASIPRELFITSQGGLITKHCLPIRIWYCWISSTAIPRSTKSLPDIQPMLRLHLQHSSPNWKFLWSSVTFWYRRLQTRQSS